MVQLAHGGTLHALREARLRVLVTSQSTGADGEAYTVAFLGQRALTGRGDTLHYVSSPTSISDETGGRISANRTTSAWKTDLDLQLSYDNEQPTVRDMDDQGRVTGEHTFPLSSAIGGWTCSW